MAVRGSISGELKALKAGLPEFFAREARKASGMVRDEVRDLTPVGRVVDPLTGKDLGPSGALKRSIRPLPVVRTGPDTWTTGAYSLKQYASYVEYGTRRHIINGRPHLAFWAGGRLVITRRVMHPGTNGHHMFLLGATAAEAKYIAGGADARLQGFLDGYL